MAFIKITEQPSLYNDLEKKPIRELLEDINEEDHKVADAVQKAIPQIEKLVTEVVKRMKQGGRLFYMGAGTSGNSANFRYASYFGYWFDSRRRACIALPGRKCRG